MIESYQQRLRKGPVTVLDHHSVDAVGCGVNAVHPHPNLTHGLKSVPARITWAACRCPHLQASAADSSDVGSMPSVIPMTLYFSSPLGASSSSGFLIHRTTCPQFGQA